MRSRSLELLSTRERANTLPDFELSSLLEVTPESVEAMDSIAQVVALCKIVKPLLKNWFLNKLKGFLHEDY